MKIAAAQMDIAWHNRQANYKKARYFAQKASEKGADIIVFPEMFSTGFSMDTNITPEPPDGPTPSLLRELAQKYKMFVLGGYVHAPKNGRPQNVSLAVDCSGADLAVYAKIHQIGLLGEDKNYDPGRLPTTFELEGIKTACLICYDLRFPELFRILADECGLIFVIASWPSVRQAHWDILLQARAVENQCYIVGVNRVGKGGGHNFSGGSVIVDPFGSVLTSGDDKETLVFAEINPAKVNKVREEMPFLKDKKAHL